MQDISEDNVFYAARQSIEQLGAKYNVSVLTASHIWKDTVGIHQYDRSKLCEDLEAWISYLTCIQIKRSGTVGSVFQYTNYDLFSKA